MASGGLTGGVVNGVSAGAGNGSVEFIPVHCFPFCSAQPLGPALFLLGHSGVDFIMAGYPSRGRPRLRAAIGPCGLILRLGQCHTVRA